MEETKCEMVMNYTFLLWDGIGFFGFDDNKLNRLKGQSVKWSDRFKNKRWIIFNLMAFILITFILITHLN